MKFVMNRQGVLTVGEALKTIAFTIRSVDRSLFGCLILDNREKDLPPTGGTVQISGIVGNRKLKRG